MDIRTSGYSSALDRETLGDQLGTGSRGALGLHKSLHRAKLLLKDHGLVITEVLLVSNQIRPVRSLLQCVLYHIAGDLRDGLNALGILLLRQIPYEGIGVVHLGLVSFALQGCTEDLDNIVITDDMRFYSTLPPILLIRPVPERQQTEALRQACPPR